MTRHLPSRPILSGFRRRLGILPHGLPTALIVSASIAAALLAPLFVVGTATPGPRGRDLLAFEVVDEGSGARPTLPATPAVEEAIDPVDAPPAATGRSADARAGAAAVVASAAHLEAGAGQAGDAATADARAAVAPAADEQAEDARQASRPPRDRGAADAHGRRRHRRCDDADVGDGDSCPARGDGGTEHEPERADATPRPPGDDATPPPDDD